MYEIVSIHPPYSLFDQEILDLPEALFLGDHLIGFDLENNNKILQKIDDFASRTNCRILVHYHEILSDDIKLKYPNIDFELVMPRWLKQKIWDQFLDYRQHPELTFKNFLCSFNGNEHMSRKFLLAHLHKMGWYNPNYVSKNFKFTTDQLDGHIHDFTNANESYHRKFFISDQSNDFFQSINAFSGSQTRGNVGGNIEHLGSLVTDSFIHLVSETMATSYHPYITEKFLFSVVTRGLFVAYGQPNWHHYISEYWGFRLYTKIFDYNFDQIKNPIERLLALTGMLSKFSCLSSDDWKDLYQLERESIEYNYDHYFSGRYMDCFLRSHNGRIV